MSITRFNKSIAYFMYDREKTRPYTKLEDLYKKYGKDKIYKVLGLYVNNGRYGEQGTAVLDDVQVNLPKHLVPVIKEIRADEDLVNDINEGKVGFKIYEYYTRKYNKTAYSVNWVELDTESIEDLETPF